MKKTLLACSFIISSVFFAYAQFDLGGVKVNVGKVCGTIKGQPACMNPSTGQWEVSTGNGNSIGGNVNTGVVGSVGTVGGVRFGGSFGGSGTGVNSGQNFTGPLGLIALAQTLINRDIPFLVGLALLAFFWYLVEFIWKGRDSSEEQKKGKMGMVYSIVALFVMVSVWGIIGFIGGTLGISQGGKMSGFNLPGEN
jgi:hypothetical protein